MLENRVREWFDESVSTAGMAVANEAFVPCPCSMFGFNPMQMALIEEVYRLARELTETQFREPARSRMPEFSMN